MRNSGWSGDRIPRNRIMLIVVPLIVTMAVGLIVGIRLVSEKNAELHLSNTGQGAANSTPASPATSAPAASPSATPAASPSATPAPTMAATPTTAATNMSCVLIRPGATAAPAAASNATQPTVTGAAGTAGAANPAAAQASCEGQAQTSGWTAAPMGG